MGRPKIQIDIEQFESLMRLHPTIEDAANFFNCSHDVIERFVKDKFSDTFASFREKRAVHTRMSIKRKMIEKALSGDNTMLIWLSKNMLGMSDKMVQTTEHRFDSWTEDQLDKRIEELSGKLK